MCGAKERVGARIEHDRGSLMSAGETHGDVPALRVGNDDAGIVHVVADRLQTGIPGAREVQCKIDICRGCDAPHGIRIASPEAVTAQCRRGPKTDNGEKFFPIHGVLAPEKRSYGVALEVCSGMEAHEVPPGSYR